MRNETIEIVVPGQLTGAAKLTTYILDNISVAEERKRPAVIVCPGGGYHTRSDRESEPVILQFLSMGCHGFLMDYSVAPNRFPTSLLELAKVVALIRERSGEWNVDPERIYVCGFSAAGHLACSLGVFWNQEFVHGALGMKPEQIKPDGMILCYPVLSAGVFAHAGSFQNLLGEDADEAQRNQVSLEHHVSEDTPRAFIWHTDEDASVPVENSLLLAAALRRQRIPFELHIYPEGGHGLSLANRETSGVRTALDVPACQSWISLVKTWINS